MLTRQCYACKQQTPYDEFRQRKNGNLYPYCNDCDRAKQRESHRKKRGELFKEPPPVTPPGFKWCSMCKEVKSIDLYREAASKRIGSDLCKSCMTRSDRKAYLKKNYNMTPDEYDKMLDSQGGVCKICRKPESVVHFGKSPNLSVDHNHDTLEIRGLLCYRCNHLVGFIEQYTMDGIQQAYKYLLENDSTMS